MNIAFVYAKGRLQRLESVRLGQSASEFFYGGEQLRARGHDVNYFEIGREDMRGPASSFVDYLFSKGLLPNRIRGWVLLGVKRILPELNRHDLIVASSTGFGFALGIWKLLGFCKPEIVAIHCGIFNYQPNWLRRLQISYLLRNMWSVVFGEAECPVMQAEFGIGPDRMRVNGFGVDSKFWTPGAASGGGEYLLAVGNDSRRDYDLLVRVAARLPWKFILVTWQTISAPIPPNVEVRSSSWHQEAISDLDLRDLYRGASCVLVPLIDSLQPSGQSVTLQAMACGKPVILTRTRGLWSEAEMRDGHNVVFVPPRDEAKLEQAIQALMKDPARRETLGEHARQAVQEHFEIGSFVDRLEDVCRAALAGKQR